MLLEALVDNDGENSSVTANMEMANVKNRSSKSSNSDLIGSSNFVFDCFFRRQEEKVQFQAGIHGSNAHKSSELAGASLILCSHKVIHIAMSFGAE